MTDVSLHGTFYYQKYKNFYIFNMKFKHLLNISLAMAAAASFTACSDADDPKPVIDPDVTSGLYVICQGNFGSANSSITFYDPETNVYAGEVFVNTNKIPLGELAQSMTIDGDDAWIVVNNSHVVYKTDADDLELEGSITEGLTSPRYFKNVGADKAYITQLYSNRIAIVDTKNLKVTGYIEVPGMDVATGSTEMMVQHGKYVYVNCWSYQKSVIRIDTTTDKVDASLEVGLQPKSMVMDKNHDLWILTDGSYEGSPAGHEAPRLVKVTTADFKVAATYEMTLNDYTPALAINGAGDRLYFIRNDVYTMSITDTALPAEPLIDCKGNYYYGLTVDPVRSDIYIADAIDYVQPGRVLRYNSKGELTQSFATGVSPQAFCWYDPSAINAK